MHLPDGEARSEIRSLDFFLAVHDAGDPEAELHAAIEAWFSTSPDAGDAHPRCRFPARYAWLQAQLALPDAGAPRCEAFDAFARPSQLRSVSVLMVSGFLGNPASSFGHALVKLNHHDDTPGGRLLDLSFNFGAKVPKDEPMPLYVLKGMFGGYHAAFDGGMHYAHDQVYVRTEFRDIWEYELALAPEETWRVAAHLWETRGRLFGYYFLTRNCAYRIAELLSVAIQRPDMPPARVWFTPVELFHWLDGRIVRDPPLVGRVRFEPSSQRRLYAQYERLSPEEAVVFNRAITHPHEVVGTALEPFPQDRQIELVDALLAWYEYRITSFTDTPPDPLMLEAKTALLRLRFELPPRVEPVAPVRALPAPTEGSRGMLAGAGATWRHDRAQALIRYAPYLQDLLGQSSSDVVELGVLDGEGRIHDDEVRLDRIELLRVRRLAEAPDIAGESRLSWQLRMGVGREVPVGVHDGDNPLRAQFTGGIGRAARWGATTLTYASMDVTGLAGGPYGRAGPSVGVVAGPRGFRMRAQLGVQAEVDDGDWITQGDVEARFTLRRNLEIRAGWRQWDHDGDAWVGVFSYW